MCPSRAATFVSSHLSFAFCLICAHSSWRSWYWFYLSLKVPDSVVYVRVGNRSLSGVLLLLSVIVMLGVGDGCLYTDWVLGGCSELLDLDLVGE